MPTVDRPPHPQDPPAEYPDWNAETTRVALVAKYAYQTWDEALAYFKHRYGRVIENCSTAKWWAARVPRKRVD